jgi:hypothetical protein
MALHRHGGLAAASLEFLRPLADEIVIAFDSRISDDELVAPVIDHDGNF